MKTNDWISVKDNLPELYEEVLVCVKNDNGFYQVRIGALQQNKSSKLPIGSWYVEREGIFIKHITHWQYIVLPKNEENYEK